MESSPLALHIALANSSAGVHAEEVYSFIESGVQGAETYARKPNGKGAIDYVVLFGALNVAANIAEIGNFLFTAYEKFIAKQKRSDAGLHVVFQRPDGAVIEMRIGTDYQDREVFVGDFIKNVETHRVCGDALQDFERTISEVKRSGIWIRRK